MKRIIIGLVASLGLVASISSCKGYFDTEPSNSTGTEKALKEASLLQPSLRGLFDGLQGGRSSTSYYGQSFTIIGDVRGDDMQCPTVGSRGIITTRWTIPVAISRGLGSRSTIRSVVLTASCRCAKSSLREPRPAYRRRSLTPRHKLRPYAHSATSTSAVSTLRLTPTPTTGLRWVSPSSRVSPTNAATPRS